MSKKLVITGSMILLMFGGCATSFVKEPLKTFHYGHNFSANVSVDEVMYVVDITSEKKDITKEEYEKLKKIFQEAMKPSIANYRQPDNPYVISKLKHYKPFWERFLIEREYEKALKRFKKFDFRGKDRLLTLLKKFEMDEKARKLQEAYKNAFEKYALQRYSELIVKNSNNLNEIREVDALLKRAGLQNLALELEKASADSLAEDAIKRIGTINQNELENIYDFLREAQKEELIAKIEDVRKRYIAEQERKRREQERLKKEKERLKQEKERKFWLFVQKAVSTKNFRVNYCDFIGRDKEVEYKNEFGDKYTKKIALPVYVYLERLKLFRSELNRDLEGARFWGQVYKKFVQNDDWIDWFLKKGGEDLFYYKIQVKSGLSFLGSTGMVPLKVDLRSDQLQAKNFLVTRTLSTSEMVSGLVDYFGRSRNKKEFANRLLLFKAYWLFATRIDRLEGVDWRTLNIDPFNDLFVDVIIEFLQKEIRNYKLATLFYRLAKHKDPVRWMLAQPRVKRIFNEMKREYERVDCKQGGGK